MENGGKTMEKVFWKIKIMTTIQKICEKLKITQSISGRNGRKVRRFNPYNPLAYTLLILAYTLLILLTLIGVISSIVVGVWENLKIDNPFKYK